jgi:hypothetical protein
MCEMTATYRLWSRLPKEGLEIAPSQQLQDNEPYKNRV